MIMGAALLFDTSCMTVVYNLSNHFPSSVRSTFLKCTFPFYKMYDVLAMVKYVAKPLLS